MKPYNPGLIVGDYISKASVCLLQVMHSAMYAKKQGNGVKLDAAALFGFR